MSKYIQEVLEDVMNELFDEISLGLCFELHRSCKIGTIFLEDMDDEWVFDYVYIYNKN